MKRNTLVPVAAGLLLVGAAAFLILRQTGDDTLSRNTGDSPSPIPARRAAGGKAVPDDAPGSSSRSRDRSAGADGELISKYGESRTSMSRLIVKNMTELMDDMIHMGELAVDGKLGIQLGGADSARSLIPLRHVIGDIELSEEQKEKAQALVLESQRRSVENLKIAVNGMRGNPEKMMELILAGDAFQRGEITADEYKGIQTQAGEELDGLVNPLNHQRNFGGGSGRALEDEAFVTGMREILDAEQNALFQEKLDGHSDENSGVTSMAAMELEKLDEAVTAGKKLTGGLRQMLEGIGGLQEFAPPQGER